MCGIVGRAGKLAAADEKLFRVLLLLDWLRGQDSTGVASISKKGAIVTLKVADDPIILMKHSDYESTIHGAMDAIWIGHNRASTVGASTRENAHPFTHKHITGVHNGTLEKDSLTELRKGVSEYYDTDSETIFAHMAEHGVKETVAKMQGAWALVWYDASDKSLNMLKNDQRPLYTAKLKEAGGESLIWASEYNMIAAAKIMADNKSDYVRDEGGFCFFPLPDNLHHKWYLDSLLEGDADPDTIVEVFGLPPKPKLAPLPDTMGFAAPTKTVTAPNTETATNVVVKDTAEVYELTVTEADEEEGHYFGGQLTHDEWDYLASDGCAYCGVDVTPDMPGLAVFPVEQIVLCPKCSGNGITTVGGNLGEVLENINVISAL